MFGLVVIEVMTPSGHLSNINEMEKFIKQAQLSKFFFRMVVMAIWVVKFSSGQYKIGKIFA